MLDLQNNHYGLTIDLFVDSRIMQSYISSEFASEIHILFYGIYFKLLLSLCFILQYELNYDYYNYASEKHTEEILETSLEDNLNHYESECNLLQSV